MHFISQKFVTRHFAFNQSHQSNISFFSTRISNGKLTKMVKKKESELRRLFTKEENKIVFLTRVLQVMPCSSLRSCWGYFPQRLFCFHFFLLLPVPSSSTLTSVPFLRGKMTSDITSCFGLSSPLLFLILHSFPLSTLFSFLYFSSCSVLSHLYIFFSFLLFFSVLFIYTLHS